MVNFYDTITIIKETSFIVLIALIHYISSFYIKETNYEILFDNFESSPLFDFNLGKSCSEKSHIIFHVLEERKENNNNKINIDKINGHYFCYKYKPYRRLLYNNQIIKKEEKCDKEYPKDCGIIDTLNQHLCIKDTDSCPINDIRIGKNSDSFLFYYHKDSNIYYDKDIYDDTNKKIIGKLILNDGQPCFRSNEKIWKIFNKDKNVVLKCQLEINGKLNDDRYINKGDITYEKLYEDNLSKKSQYLFLYYMKNKEKVSLYSREFLGIDKECDEKSKLNKDNYNMLKSNQNEAAEYMVFEALFLVIFIFFVNINICSNPDYFINDILVFLVVLLIFNLINTIFQITCLWSIISYNVEYNCSDDLTNEIFKKEKSNTNNTILYISINIGLDIFIILRHLSIIFDNDYINFIGVLINLLFDKIYKIIVKIINLKFSKNANIAQFHLD